MRGSKLLDHPPSPPSGSRSAALLASSFALLVSACGAAAPPPPARPAPVVVSAPPAEVVASPPVAPELEPAEALAQALALVDRAKLHDWRPDREEVERARAEGLDEARALSLARALGRDCLAQRERSSKACGAFDGLGSDETSRVGTTLLALLGEAADPLPVASPTVTLLVRLDARGSYRAGAALDRLLSRRARATRAACVPPSPAEIAAADAGLADFLVVEPAGGVKAGSTLVARRPTADEAADLAYFYAAVAANGSEVGVSVEDRASPPKKKDDPAVTERVELSARLTDALLDGDLARHAELADRYLRSLGYPDAIRVAEEGDARWGGAGYAFVMRDAARTHELLGHAELAASLYRRAPPGGGACGTSTESRRADQIAGVIRTTEESIGCRGVVAELLYASDAGGDVGPARLASAGFDVERLYRAALLTSNREDRVALEHAFASAPSLAAGASARLARLGEERWVERVRAVAGFADTARKSGVERLLHVAEAGAGATRVEAVRALGELVEDRGYDPCDDLGFGWGSGTSSGERRVRSVMHACDGSVSASEMKKIAARLAKLTRDPDDSFRAAVATALGRTGASSAKAALASLVKDPAVIAGSEVCRSRGDGPSICEPNRPVHLAAEDALAALADADAHRRELAKERAKTKPVAAKR